jgi:EAL domain-containing protein (putative c-di-GMP-specific phosphodiesterase class I)
MSQEAKMSYLRNQLEISPDFQDEALAPGAGGDLSSLVRHALASDRLKLEFQPVLAAGSSSQVLFHEGLIRLQDGGGRTIPAARFINAMELSPLGRDLDCAALRLGLKALQQNPRLRLSINASARSIGNLTWRDLLLSGLDGVASRLIIEFGEASTALGPERVARFLAEVQPKGLRFVLDDFGSAPISLRQLRDCRFDGVKFGGSLVRGIDSMPDNQPLVGALVGVAHRFGMFAIAKGVETAAEASALRALGVDGLQGFHLGRPRSMP